MDGSERHSPVRYQVDPVCVLGLIGSSGIIGVGSIHCPDDAISHSGQTDRQTDDENIERATEEERCSQQTRERERNWRREEGAGSGGSGSTATRGCLFSFSFCLILKTHSRSQKKKILGLLQVHSNGP